MRSLVHDALAVSLLLLPEHPVAESKLLSLCNSNAPAIAFSLRGVEYDDADMRDLIGARAAGECTCKNAATENAKPTGSTCACGARPASELPSSKTPLYLHVLHLLTPARCLQLRKGL